MAISRDEIDKYIFNPENPNQCKSYSLLLRIAKKESYTFFSPEFLQYFFQNQIITKKFEEELWDKPDNYNDLNIVEKLRLYEKNFSHNERIEFIKKIDLDINKLKKLIFSRIAFIETNVSENIREALEHQRIEPYEIGEDDYRLEILNVGDSELISKAKNILSFYDSNFNSSFINYLPYSNQYDNGFIVSKKTSEEYSNNLIIFSRNYFDIIEFNLSRASIFITLEENIDKFLEYKNNKNIKPIFLKKIEDVEILLNVLEQDLKKEKQKTQIQEFISTIDKVTIENFFSIKEIKLNNLKDKKEIYIVGENGDGKSLFLQAIAIALAGVKEGDIFDLVKSQSKYKLSVIDSDKKEYTQNSEQAYNYILAYGASRNNYCQMKEDETGYLTLFKGEYDLKSPIKWLQYLDYSEKSNKENVLTVDEAKELLQHLLNSDIKIDISADKVTFTEKGSEVNFDQLSAGYKGVITIICDLIARLSEKQQVEQIADFQGVVLIDEIELHLHPKWQYGFMNKLRETFPLIQFIVTTHSPTVLLGAGMEAVYYQIYKEEGVVKVSEQKEVKNDFLNDIQSDIFGFDVNDERINYPSEDDKKRQKRAKEAMLSLIDTIEKGE